MENKTKSYNKHLFLFLIFYSIMSIQTIAQLDYELMENWAFHPDKSGTLLSFYNLNIGVVDKNLETDSLIYNTNNSMTNTGVDVFFVHPTILNDIWSYTERKNIPLDEQPAFQISASIVGQAGLLATYGRFFAPRYRQASPPSFLGSPLDSLQAAILKKAYHDVKEAFLHYLENHNGGNKIILASHSQGAYLSAMLLHDLFDKDEELRRKLVVAIIGGVVSTYSDPPFFQGGWWEHIPLCTEITQCGCVITWRSYKEGQSLPGVQISAPQYNPYLKELGYVYKLLDPEKHIVLQDSVFYSDQPAPLRNYIVPKTNQSYGGNVGFIAFDHLYQIRFKREGPSKVGFMVEHTPQANDQRPNNLLEAESQPFFNVQGYHIKDYNIYSWALMQQINQKLASCDTTTDTRGIHENKNMLKVYPNPALDIVYVIADRNIIQLSLYNADRQKLINQHYSQQEYRNPQGYQYSLNINELKVGLYFIQAKFSDGTRYTAKIVKE
ncbi:MAG: DUF3089 domain-containing protein [Saprospirales bacterium]|nr:MAG: DUF3089 domain-containing protein [Saprospirales bacterium]